MRLAHNEDQMDIYRHYVQMAKGVGIDFELIDAPKQADVSADDLRWSSWGVVGSLMVILTSQLTQALARRARRRRRGGAF